MARERRFEFGDEELSWDPLERPMAGTVSAQPAAAALSYDAPVADPSEEAPAPNRDRTLYPGGELDDEQELGYEEELFPITEPAESYETAGYSTVADSPAGQDTAEPPTQVGWPPEPASAGPTARRGERRARDASVSGNRGWGYRGAVALAGALIVGVLGALQLVGRGPQRPPKRDLAERPPAHVERPVPAKLKPRRAAKAKPKRRARRVAARVPVRVRRPVAPAPVTTAPVAATPRAPSTPLAGAPAAEREFGFER